MPQPKTFFVSLVWKFSMNKDQILKYSIFPLYKDISTTQVLKFTKDFSTDRF